MKADRRATVRDHAHRRLEQLYAISKLLASFEDVEEMFDSAIAIAAETLPLRSAILIEVDESEPRIVVWPSEGRSSEEVRAAQKHAEKAYAYLAGDTTSETFDLLAPAGSALLPRDIGEPGPEPRFIVLPLVVGRRSIFGVLQLEAAGPLDETVLVFVNAIVNQLAVALDRYHAWKRDVVLRERAERATQARERILAIVSHDLRNPLATILMTAELLASSGLPDSKERRKGLRPAIERIRRSAKRMNRLIEDLLDLASIEAGRLSLKRALHDPGSIVREAIASFEHVAKEKTLHLSGAHADRPRIHCDRDRILQVLSNLLGNAVKVTPEGGSIVIGADAVHGEVVFTVSDTGPGIAQHELDRIFEPYVRGDEPMYKGTGLGLFIARSIVEAHGGRIWAESAPGSGATFSFTVPAERAGSKRE